MRPIPRINEDELAEDESYPDYIMVRPPSFASCEAYTLGGSRKRRLQGFHSSSMEFTNPALLDVQVGLWQEVPLVVSFTALWKCRWWSWTESLPEMCNTSLRA